MKRQKDSLSPAEYDRFLDWYYDHFFSNRWETLADNLNSPENYLHPATRYNALGEEPLSGYRAARDYLWGIPVEKITLADIDKAQAHLLSWRSTRQSRTLAGWLYSSNSENSPAEALGQARRVSVYYDILEFHKDRSDLPDADYFLSKPNLSLDPTKINETNPYLFHREWNGYNPIHKVAYTPISQWRRFKDILPPDLVKRILAAETKHSATTDENFAEREAEARKKNDLLRDEEIAIRDRDTLAALENGYMLPRQKESSLAYNRSYMHELYGARAAREVSRIHYERYVLDDHRSKEIDNLRADYLKAILSHRWDKLHAELAAAKTDGAVLAAIGSFHYDFLSIHPYQNGNGRMARLMTEKLLSRYGLPPPIWKHFGEDIALPKSEFIKILRDSVSLSSQFHQDLDAVTSGGIPYSAAGTGYLVPNIAQPVAKRFPVDAEQFLAWVAAGNQKFPKVEGALAYFEQWRDEVAKKNNLHLGTPFFIGTFGRPSPTEKAYRAKLEEHYSTESVHRAVLTERSASDEELLKTFTPGLNPTDPAPIVARFNSAVVRNLAGTAEWLDTGWWRGDPAQKAGLVRVYRDPARAKAEAVGRSGGTLLEIESRERRTAALDSSVPAKLNDKSAPKYQGILFLAGGMDPESIVRVRASGPDGSSKVAERLSFDRIEIRVMKGSNVVSKKIYELSSDGIWRPVGSVR